MTNRYHVATIELMPRSDWMLEVRWLEPSWYSAPEFEVTAFPPDSGYGITVELRRDEEGAYVTGVAVRRHKWAGYKGERTHVPPRDVQRLPLARVVRAALAHVNALPAEPPKPSPPPKGMTSRPLDPRVRWQCLYYDVGTADERWQRSQGGELGDLVSAGKILVPRGRPKPRHATKFYLDLAETYRALAKTGVSPVKEIAKRKRVPENTVHQWVHRMRKLGFLEPPPRTRKAESDA